MSYQKEREEFIAVLVEELAGKARHNVIVDAARELLRRATTSQRLAERFCSEEMSDELAERLNKRDDNNDAAIKKLCETWGLVPVLGGDPRGATVKVKLPSGRWNTWGGAEHGWAVPTREG